MARLVLEQVDGAREAAGCPHGRRPTPGRSRSWRTRARPRPRRRAASSSGTRLRAAALRGERRRAGALSSTGCRDCSSQADQGFGYVRLVEHDHEGAAPPSRTVRQWPVYPPRGHLPHRAARPFRPAVPNPFCDARRQRRTGAPRNARAALGRRVSAAQASRPAHGRPAAARLRKRRPAVVGRRPTRPADAPAAAAREALADVGRANGPEPDSAFSRALLHRAMRAASPGGTSGPVEGVALPEQQHHQHNGGHGHLHGVHEQELRAGHQHAAAPMARAQAVRRRRMRPTASTTMNTPSHDERRDR